VCQVVCLRGREQLDRQNGFRVLDDLQSFNAAGSRARGVLLQARGDSAVEAGRGGAAAILGGQ